MRLSLRARIGVLAALALAAMAAAVGPPMRTAWACLARAEGAARADGRVVEIDEGSGVAIEIVGGAHDGGRCTIRSFGTVERGATYPIVVYPDATERCDFVATIDNSRDLLLALSGASAALALLVVLAALRLARSAAAVSTPTTRLRDVAAPPCPRCAKPMDEGVLVPMSGVHWRARNEPIGLPSALGGLPGTFRWGGRARLHAFRCEPCQVATFRYGSD